MLAVHAVVREKEKRASSLTVCDAFGLNFRVRSLYKNLKILFKNFKNFKPRFFGSPAKVPPAPALTNR